MEEEQEEDEEEQLERLLAFEDGGGGGGQVAVSLQPPPPPSELELHHHHQQQQPFQEASRHQIWTSSWTQTSTGQEQQSSLPDLPEDDFSAFGVNAVASETEGVKEGLVFAPEQQQQQQQQQQRYWERRRRNNMAAKRSRDARRVRENQLRVKVLCLENANRVLRAQVEEAREENQQLRLKMTKATTKKAATKAKTT